MGALDTVQSNVTFQLRATLGTTATSVAISDDLTNGGVCAFTDASILLTNSDGTVIERTKATASGGILTFSKRGIKLDKTLIEDASLKKEWRAGTFGYLTMFAYDMFDVEGDMNVSGNVTPVDPTKPGFRPQTLTQAQIDALPTTGTGIVFNSDTGLYQMLVGGVWQDVDSGTPTPNASETVAGKAQTATDAQTDAGDSVGDTSAKLFATPASISKSVRKQAYSYFPSSGTANAYAITASPAPSAYVEGMRFAVKFHAANTGASTIDVNGLGAKSIKRIGAVGELSASDISEGQIVELTYDGTNFQMTSPKSTFGNDYFGDGSDGNVTISANTTLTRDMHYANLTINDGKWLKPNGFRVFVKGKLTRIGTGNIQSYGGNGGDGGQGEGALGTAGARANTAGTLPASSPGAAGAGRSSGNQTNAQNGTSTVRAINEATSSASGNGGLGGGSAAVPPGSAGTNTGTKINPLKTYADVYNLCDLDTTYYRLQIGTSPGGGGAGGYGGSPTYSSAGSGGGSGAPGGILFVAANTIVANNTNVLFDVHGGNGGNGGSITGTKTQTAQTAGGGGGGAGGNGGIVILVNSVCDQTISSLINVAPGTGGAGGTGEGNTGGPAGGNGTAGSNGTAGMYKIITV